MRLNGLTETFCIALMCFCAIDAHPQQKTVAEVALRSVVSTDTVTVGDPVHLSVYITLQIGFSAETIHSPFAGLPQMELADVRDSTIQSGSATIRKFVFTALPFEPGVFVTDSIHVRYRADNDTTEKGISFPGDTIVVRSVLDENSTEIKPEKPPFPFEVSDFLIVLAVLILLALIGIIIVTVFWLRKRRRARPVRIAEPVVPARPPSEKALEALIALSKTRLLSDGRFKAFHIKASEIVRVYIEEQFGVDALEMTTPQLLSNLRSIELPDETVDIARHFLEDCDLVKFAKHVPTAIQSDETLNSGIVFVRKTSENDRGSGSSPFPSETDDTDPEG